jgi:hypothetical protein
MACTTTAVEWLNFLVESVKDGVAKIRVAESSSTSPFVGRSRDHRINRRSRLRPDLQILTAGHTPAHYHPPALSLQHHA